MDHKEYLKELSRSDMERMMIPMRYWDCSLDEVTNVDSGVNSMGLAKSYISNIHSFMKDGSGLLLWGKNGRGKTGMAVVLAKWARRCGYRVLFSECSDLKRSVIEKIRFDEEFTMWERARSVDLLIMDDLGKGTRDSTGFGLDLLDELIRHRSANRRALIITTNVDVNVMGAELKTSTLHLLKECTVPHKVIGCDRRELTQAELVRSMKVDD